MSDQWYGMVNKSSESGVEIVAVLWNYCKFRYFVVRTGTTIPDHKFGVSGVGVLISMWNSRISASAPFVVAYSCAQMRG